MDAGVRTLPTRRTNTQAPLLAVSSAGPVPTGAAVRTLRTKHTGTDRTGGSVGGAEAGRSGEGVRMLQVGRTNVDTLSGELFHAGLCGVWATDSVGERMAMTELRLLLEDRSISSPEEMRTWRESLGLDVNAVAGALLLSTAQVRDLESGSTRAFYNEGFYQRAKMKYVRSEEHTSELQSH